MCSGTALPPVLLDVKKAISCRIRASNRLVRILTFKRVIATVNRPPLIPVKTNVCVTTGSEEGGSNEAGHMLFEKTGKAVLLR